MRKLYLTLFALLVFLSFRRGQIKDSAIIVRAQGITPGDSIYIPVNVKKFNKVGAFGWYIIYDTNQLAMNDTTCLRNVNKLLNGANATFGYHR